MMLRKFTKKIRPFGVFKKILWIFKNHDFFLKISEKNLEKKNQKINFDLEKTLLNEKVAKTPKNDPFLVKSAKKICLGSLLTQKRRFSTFSAISRVTAPFHGPTLTLSKNPSGSKFRGIYSSKRLICFPNASGRLNCFPKILWSKKNWITFKYPSKVTL